MRELYALVLAMSVSFGTIAQFSELEDKSQFLKRFNDLNIEEVNESSSSSRSTASVDTIWADDFSDPSKWSFVGGVNEWNISNTLTPSLISQGFDTSLNSNSGGNFAIIDSDGPGGGNTQNAFIEYVGGSIDCSTQPFVRLVFQTYLSQYNESRQVLISNDGGSSWDTIPVLTQFGTSVISPNVHTEIVDISAAAGGHSNVKIRFHYVGSFDWFWCVDDVSIVSTLDNELQLTQEYYNSVSDSRYSNYYQKIPLRQANAAIITFGAEFVNMGVLNQTNAHFSTSVNYGGNLVYNENSDSVNAVQNSITALDLDSVFHPNMGMGVYNVHFKVSSDSVDEYPLNNVIRDSFEVSGNQYQRDNDTISNDPFFNVNNSLEILLRYEMYTTDTVIAISTFFPYSSVTGRGVNVGDSISFYLYNAIDLITPVSVHKNYIVKPEDVNGWVTLSMPDTTLTPGIYYAGFKVNNDNSSVGSNSIADQSTPPYIVLLRKDVVAPSDQWQYTTSFTPFIRLYTKTKDACSGANISILNTITDTSTYGSVDLSVSGGAPPYDYSWIGPNGFTANSQDIYGLTEQGAYTVTVTDFFGCEGVDTSLVGGAVFVQEIESTLNLELFPNPNSGSFTLAGDVPYKGDFTISIINVLGHEVFSQKMLLLSQFSEEVELPQLSKGVYQLIVSDSESVKKSVTFIVNE